MKEAALFLLCLTPFLRLVWAGFHAGLGVNPVEFIEHYTGDWTLNFFCFGLAVTPLARLSGWSWWAKRRRMVGLFVFFYAALHFAIYLGIDTEFEINTILSDIERRRYITVGFASFTILAALAATSTDASIRLLRRWWPRLHSLVYPAAVLGVIHYYWLVKSDHRRPLRYAAIIGALLAYRVVVRLQARMVRPAT